MLPSPTADPVAAKIKMSRDDHCPCIDILLLGLMTIS
tara:strand:+ start:1668 stop:1778 length:111 start_codon:yes stop_codon:yes gene_type:complete